MAAERPAGRRGDRLLLLALAGLVAVLALTLVGAWTSVRQLPVEPVAVPSVARA